MINISSPYRGIVHSCEMYVVFYTNEINYIEKNYSDYIIEKDNKKFTMIMDTIKFTFVKHIGYTTLKIDFIKLLNKPNIIPQDINEIYSKIYEILNEISRYHKEPILKRFDFRLDTFVANKNDINTIFRLYKKCISNIYTLEKCDFENLFYKSKSKNYSLSVNIYSKDKEKSDKNQSICDYEKNIIRYEIQLRNKHLNYKKSKGFDKNLETYLDYDLFSYYINRYIFPICYTGDFYTINEAKKIILKKVKGKAQQNKIINFLTTASRGNMDTVKKRYSYYQFESIIQTLEEIGLNPILIPKNYNIKSIENPLNNFYTKQNFSCPF